jgi:dCTP deaminase
MERADAASSSGILSKTRIQERIASNDLVIRPILEPDKQINNTGFDFRLGYDFLVSVHGREAYMNASHNGESGYNVRGLKYHFQESRRQIGETFILHPSQTILATSLEYIKLPSDVLLMLFMRSSYSRLGLAVSTIVQPGYCGCLSLELTNNNFTPINLTVGARLFQGVFQQVSESTDYYHAPRKYSCQVRPEASFALEDADLKVLNEIWKEETHSGRTP